MSATLTTPERSAGRSVARWRAIGCQVHLEVRWSADLAPARALVERVLLDVDEVASRFRADSDLARVNAAPGRLVEVDPLLVAAVRVAVEAAEATGGLVHPLMGRPLAEWGYDRTFTEIERCTDLRGVPAPAVALDSWRAIELEDAAVRIPAGTALDLGATGKAWIVDLAVAALREELGADAVLSIGGDLRTTGSTAWTVGVAEHPDADPEELLEVTGALATSSTRVRRWSVDGAERHHLIDPRTGAPAGEVWRTVTVAAPTCVAANTATTAAMLLGAAAPAALAADPAVSAARLVAGDGSITRLAWPEAATGKDPR